MSLVAAADEDLGPPLESMSDIEDRHDREMADYQAQARIAVKAAKKSERLDLETQMLQGEYDLKAKHIDEVDRLELQIEKFGEFKGTNNVSEPAVPAADEEEGLSKKEKAKRKKEKKANKEREKEQKRAVITSANEGIVSARDIELQAIEQELVKDQLAIKLVASDGHCLYRAVVDQLHCRPSSDAITGVFNFSLNDSPAGQPSAAPGVKELRQAVANELRTRPEEYKPFIGLEGDEFEQYCNKVASYDGAEWGGQVEIQALCACLQRSIWIYSADTHAPILKMGSFDECPPLRISYHRQYYALGEHYNSVTDTLT